LQRYVLSSAGDALSARKLRDPAPTTAAAMATYYLIATDFFWFYLQFHKTIKLLFLFGASELEEEILLYLGRLSVAFFFRFEEPQEIIHCAGRKPPRKFFDVLGR